MPNLPNKPSVGYGQSPTDDSGFDWASLLASAGSSYLGGLGAREGAQSYKKDISTGIGLQREYVDKMFGLGLNSVPMGLSYLPKAGNLATSYTSGAAKSPYHNFSMQSSNYLNDILSGKRDFRKDPGYKFRLAESLREGNRALAAKGYDKSGNILTALSDRASNFASQEYGNIVSRLSDLQKNYADQNIAATNTMSADRQKRWGDKLGYLSNLFQNQTNMYGSAMGGMQGIGELYSGLANAGQVEAAAPYSAGAAFLGNSQATGAAINGAKSLWNEYGDDITEGAGEVWGYLSNLWNKGS